MRQSIIILSLFVIITTTATSQTLRVDGRAGTLVANVGQMPNIILNSGTYTVSLSGPGIKLWFAQPQPYRYVILWEANTNRHWLIEAGSSKTIVLDQQPTTLFAFLVDVNSVDSSGEVELAFTLGATRVEENEEDCIPHGHQLYPNYPNPFNPKTVIRYQIPHSSIVELIIQNTLGQKIRTLVSNNQAPGEYEVVWDGRDDAGDQVPSGVYIYHLKAGEFVDARKLLLIR